MHGHALGAAGALEAIATVMALHHGILPPTANYNEPDPECTLDYIPNSRGSKRVGAALSNSFAFRRTERRGRFPSRRAVSGRIPTVSYGWEKLGSARKFRE